MTGGIVCWRRKSHGRAFAEDVKLVPLTLLAGGCASWLGSIGHKYKSHDRDTNHIAAVDVKLTETKSDHLFANG